MKGMVDLSTLYDEPLNPAEIDFTTKPGRQCRTCIYQRQRISVCNEAVALAKRSGMPSCDDENIVYVVKKRDPRQVDLTKEI
jgi:hypothetical protein